MTEPGGETNAARSDLDAPDVKVIYAQILKTGTQKRQFHNRLFCIPVFHLFLALVPPAENNTVILKTGSEEMRMPQPEKPRAAYLLL